MAYTNTTIAGGTTGALPNASPVIDRIAGVDYPVAKMIDPTEGSIAPIGVNVNPLKTKARQRGTADYDSGNIAVAAGAPAVIFASAVYPEGGYVVNPGDETIVFTMTDINDNAVCVFNIAPKDTRPIPIGPGCALTGFKWGASVAGLRAQLWGGQ